MALIKIFHFGVYFFCTVVYISQSYLLSDDQYSGNGETVDQWHTTAQAKIQQRLSKAINLNVAKNVIIFVGSGLGLSTVTAARILKGQLEGHSGEESVLNFDNFPVSGLAKTYCQDYQVPDPAAAATAFLCGVKSNFGTVGVDARVTRGDCDSQEGREVSSVLDWSLQKGKSGGFVTVSRVTSAGVASLYANVADKTWEGDFHTRGVTSCKDMAAQLIDDYEDLQVILGGGRRYFMRSDQRDPEHGSNSQYGRTDARDLIEEWKERQHVNHRDYRYVWNTADFNSVNPDNTDSLLGLFESSDMQLELERKDPDVEKAGEPSLAEMTEKAIRILRKNPAGFFLMVEGSNIAKGHREGHAKVALYEALAFDDAVARAVNLTSEDDTLIVVTADVSDAMSIVGYPSRGNFILEKVDDGNGGYSTASDHRPYTTLLYADGPGFSADGGQRPDITNTDTTFKFYKQQSAVYMTEASASGTDVPIYARGPMSHLFTGTHEQSDIAHIMAFASCVGDYTDQQNCAAAFADDQITSP